MSQKTQNLEHSVERPFAGVGKGWLLRRWCWLIPGLVLVLAASGLGRQWGILWMEEFLVLGILFALCLSFPVLREYRGAARNYRVFAVVLVGAVVLGHLWKRDEDTFPFAMWTMYGHSEYGPPTNIRLEATLGDGQTIRFHPSDVIPSLRYARIETRLQAQVGRIQAADSEEREELEGVHRRTLVALAALYNRRHPANPMTAIGVHRCRMSLKGDGERPEVTSVLLWQYDISPGET